MWHRFCKGEWRQIMKAPVEYLVPSRSIAGIGLAVCILLCGSALLPAQQSSVQIEIVPASPTTNDTLSFKLSGVWRNGCIPSLSGVSISENAIRIDTVNPNIICTQALTPWSVAGSIGKLPAGEYQLTVIHTSPSETSDVELGRSTFSVSAPSNELIFPVVVNGSPAVSGIHYQTAFTLLNHGSSDLQGKLDVYTDTSQPGGVFCSSQSPSSSMVEPRLTPGQQFSQTSSGELPFVNGWARLSWDGPDALVAGAEVSLIAADPVPCSRVESRPSNEIVAGTPLPAIRAAKEFRFPVTIAVNRQSAVAVINPSRSDSVTVRITILDASGQSARLEIPTSFELTLHPLERVSKMLFQLAAEDSPLADSARLPEMFQGSIVVTSDNLIAAAVLQILFPEGKFESVAAYSSK
jgi:hypothetical protein